MHAYIFDVPDNTTIKLYGSGNTSWLEDGSCINTLNEHTYDKAGRYLINTDLYISDRKKMEKYLYDKNTIKYLTAAMIDLSYVNELPEIEKTYFFYNLFNNCTNLQNVEFSGSIIINTQVKTCYMFNNCINLNNIVGLKNIYLNNLIDMNNMFTNCENLKDSSIDVTNFKSTKWMDFKNAFKNCKGLVNITLPKSTSSEKIPVSCLSMFEGCTNLKNVINLSDYSITNARAMFFNCTSIISAPLMFIYDCKDASFMFQGCYNLNNIHNNAINFTNVLDMNVEGSVNLNTKFFTPERCRCMFAGCRNLNNIELGYINLNNIKNLEERPDIIMDENMFIKMNNECIFKNHSFWNMPINFSNYGIENISTYSEFSSMYDFIFDENTYETYIVSKSKLYPTIFFTDPMNFIDVTSCSYLSFYYSENDNIEYNKNINNIIYPMARKIKYYVNDGYETPPYVKLELYIYENTERKLIKKLKICTNKFGTIRYKFNYTKGNINYKINSKNLNKYRFLPSFKKNGSLISEDELLIKIMKYENDEIKLVSESISYELVDDGEYFIELKYPLGSNKINSLSFMNSYISNIYEFSGIDCSTSEDSLLFYKMFYDCEYLETIDKSFFRKFYFNKADTVSYMFYKCNALYSVDFSEFDFSNIKDMSYMFCDCYALTSLDLSNLDTNNVITMSHMVDYCFVETLKLTNLENRNLKDMSYMITNCLRLKSLDLTNFKTDNVTNMKGVFSTSCRHLDKLDLSSFNTSNVTDMSRMFGDLSINGSGSSLISLDLSNFDTSNVTDMSHMFEVCNNLNNLNISSFDTSNVTDMSCMFKDCSSLSSLDLTNFYTSNVTNMEEMFNNCTNLNYLNLSSFITANLTSYEYMFKNVLSNCSVLINLDIEKWPLELNETKTGFEGTFSRVYFE